MPNRQNWPHSNALLQQSKPVVSTLTPGPALARGVQRLSTLGVARHQGHGQRSPSPDQLYRHRRSDPGVGHQPLQMGRVLEKRTAEFHQQIPRLDSRPFSRATRRQLTDQHPLSSFQPQTVGLFLRDRLDAHPQPGPGDTTFSTSWVMIGLAMLVGIAKPIPWPAATMAVLIPITSP